MKLKAMHALVTAGTAAAMLAGCTGGRGQPPPSGPVPSTPPASSATSSPAPEPTGGAGEVNPVGSPAPTRPRPAKPMIGRVWTTPELSCDGSFCPVLGTGTVTFHAQVNGATSVTVALVSTGTGPDRTRHVLGVDHNGRDGWSVRWTYPDEPLLAHLAVTARGPGGTTEALPFAIYHPDRLGPTVARVWTQPALTCPNGRCTLPPGAGVLTIHAEVLASLSRVAFILDPADGEPYQIDTGYVRHGDDYSVTWSYPDQPLRATLRIVAGNNLGQTTFTSFELTHP